MTLFKNNCIDLSNQKDVKDLLIKISNAIFQLSNSEVFNNRILIGGIYHKNYYNYICSGFFNGNNIIYNQKNVPISEFLYNLKQNMCNFGFYFMRENNQLILKIYSGNTFVLDINQQNFIENYINKHTPFTNNEFKILKPNNFY